MSGEELDEKRKHAICYFRKRWRHLPREVAEDFGSYCVVQWLSGRDENTGFLFLGVDFFRLYSIRTGRGCLDAMGQKKRSVQLEKVRNRGVESRDLKEFELGHLRHASLDRDERCCLILYFKWGFKLTEIGECLGVTESMASVIKDRAIEKLRDGRGGRSE